MSLGDANTLLREISMRCQISLDAGKALLLEVIPDGTDHRQRSVDLAYHL